MSSSRPAAPQSTKLSSLYSKSWLVGLLTSLELKPVTGEVSIKESYRILNANSPAVLLSRLVRLS
jgi:hypothetical protein